MNILQQEDLVKGLPDDRLMQEAQNPSGQMPQFLLVSEVQRRSDMRKRYETQQQEQPQGTIAEQVLNGGIGSIQRPPQGQGGPPPQMPQQLPTGQGIAPGPQFPPPQPPNAELAPQGGGGYAAGGIVRLAGGGSFPYSRAGRTYQINSMGYPTQQVAFEEFLGGRNEPTRSYLTPGTTNNRTAFNQQGDLMSDAAMGSGMAHIDPTEMAGIVQALPSERYAEAMKQVIPADDVSMPDVNVPYVSSDSFNAPAPEANVGMVDLGIKVPMDRTVDAYTGEQPRNTHPDYPSMVAGHGDPISDRQMNALAPSGKDEGDWYDPLVSGISSLVKWRGGRGDPQEIEDRAAMRRANQIAQERADTWQAQIDDASTVAVGSTPSEGGIAALEGEELWSQSDVETKLRELGESNLKPVPGTDGTKTAQEKDAAGAAIQGVKSDPTTGMSLEELIEQQNRMAYSNALMQFGGGIASGDIGAGMSRAGAAMQSGQSEVNDLKAQQFRQESYERVNEGRYGTRNGEPADMRNTKWFMSLDPADQELVMRYKGREMPDMIINELVGKAITKAEGEGLRMDTEQITRMTNQLRSLYGVPPVSVDPLAEARAAIDAGAPREAVIARLTENDIDPTGL